MTTAPEKTFRDPELAALERTLSEIRLEETNLIEISSVHAWIPKARVYIAQNYPEHLISFEKAATEPSWIEPPMYTEMATALLGITTSMQQRTAVAQAHRNNLAGAHRWVNGLRETLRGIDEYGGRKSSQRIKDQKFGILDAPNQLTQDLGDPPDCSAVL